MRLDQQHCGQADFAGTLTDWRHALITRRSFLLSLAGGSLAALFGLPAAAEEETLDPEHRWRVLDAVQRHLLPSEPNAPGAPEINALAYLRFVVDDSKVDGQDRRFILKGSEWLDAMAGELTGEPFTNLDEDRREGVLRRIAASEAGENWLSTLIYYLMEALLSDPVYGGNPGGIGWKWLEHTPGYPRPPADKTYPRLPT